MQAAQEIMLLALVVEVRVVLVQLQRVLAVALVALVFLL
jgi:hypothetical protein